MKNSTVSFFTHNERDGIVFRSSPKIESIFYSHVVLEHVSMIEQLFTRQMENVLLYTCQQLDI